MQMITNYLNSFENYLPDESKEDVRAELESSILAQIEDKQLEIGRELNLQEQEQLLLKIGHPMRVAAAYLPDQQLINKDYFPAYKQSLEIALVIFCILTILVTIPFSLSIGSIIVGLIQLSYSLLETSVWVFSSVTLIFYLMQKYGASLDEIYAWSPKQLRYTSKKISLSRIEVIFEMLFEGLFLVIWNRLFTSEDVFIDSDFLQSISMSSEWQSVYVIVNLLVGLSILLSLYKLLVSGWTKVGLIASIGIGLVDIALIIYILQFDQFIVVESSAKSELDWQQIGWSIELNIKILLGIIGLVTAWDVVSGIKKFKVI